MRSTFFLSSLLLISCITSLRAQTSWNANPLGIPGSDNSAFGVGALNGGTSGNRNTATGNNALRNVTSGSGNTANGQEALYSNTTGGNNTAIGRRALYSNQSGTDNTANGYHSLYSNTTGGRNTAIGKESLYSNVSGNNNTADGFRALYSNTGSDNTAIGHNALYSNTSGSRNTAFGKNALLNSTTGSDNTAIGFEALYNNNGAANRNVAVGGYALYSSTTGDENTAVGYEAGFLNGTGSYNSAAGYESLLWNYSGSYNVALGPYACLNTNDNGNVGVGVNALINNTTFANVGVGFNSMVNNTTGIYNTALGEGSLQLAGFGTDNNTAIGAYADMNGAYDNATAIGAAAVVTTSNKVRIGNGAVTVVECQVAPGPVSDGRFKFNLSESDVKGITFIKKLRPVVYNFDGKKMEDFVNSSMPESIRKQRPAIDYTHSDARRQTGFIAQEVEKAASEVGYDFSGVHHPEHESDNYSLSYSMFVVPLVKAVQEQQALLAEQKQTAESLREEIRKQEQQMNNLKTGSQGTGIAGISLTEGSGFALDAQPNPFSTETLISYTLPKTVNQAYLAIYDLNGKQALSVPLTEKGSASIQVSSDKLDAGIYIYSIIADGKLMGSKRLVVAGK